MREFINKQGKYIAVAAIVLAIGVAYLVYGHGTKHFGSNSYFVDEETGDEVVMPRATFPPINGKSGKPTVVGVFKFSCDGGKTVTIGYYYKYTDAAKQKLEDMTSGKTANDSNYNTRDGMLIRAPEKGSPWVGWNSAEAIPIRKALMCPGGREIEEEMP